MNKKVAVSLSKCLTIVFGLILIGSLFFIPYITGFIDYYLEKKLGTPFTVALYLSDAVGLVVLIFVYQLLKRLEKNLVFVAENAASIRNIGFCMFALALISAVLGFVRIKTPGMFSFAFSFLFLFLGIIMLTLANVFRAAVSMKEEQDFTI